MKFLLPLILLLIGSGAGVGAGLYLRPAPDETAVEAEAPDESGPEEKTDEKKAGKEYVKLSNQFVVPIVQEGRISSMVVLSLSVEVSEGKSEMIYDTEPRLRDAFLRALFDFSNIGGFDGHFTDNANLDVLRRSLRAVGMKTMGKEIVSDVLISEIARQDY